MKRLVLIGEGHGEVTALPVLAKRLLGERIPAVPFFVDPNIIRARGATDLVRWDKDKNLADHREWVRRVSLAGRRPKVGGVLAVFDGDARNFPAGSASPFCAVTAAKSLAAAAAEVGAGKIFSLAVVFACVEYESWIIAGIESLAGKSFKDGRPAPNLKFPDGPPESHGKRWLEANFDGYRPTRDQSALTELLDFSIVRTKNLRSFVRLENALNQLSEAAGNNAFISTPT